MQNTSLGVNVKLHVCSMATRPTRNLSQLCHSCDIHGLSLEILGDGMPFRGLGDKIKLVQKHLETLPENDVVMLVDAYDVLILGGENDILSLFFKMNTPFVISAERNCFPDASLADLYPATSSTTFKYLNSGSYIGYVGYLKKLFNDYPPFNSADDDQLLIGRHFVANPDRYMLDTHCQLFLTTFALTEDELTIDVQNKRIRCVETDTLPIVIHANGHSGWYQRIYDCFYKRACPAVPEIVSSKTVFLALLARDMAPFLPQYLSRIERLDYDKSLMTISIITFNNSDGTQEILENWAHKNRHLYHQILFDSEDIPNLFPLPPYTKRLPPRADLPHFVRKKSLSQAIQTGCDYYFVVDLDTFIEPSTLKALIAHDKPFIAPMLDKMFDTSRVYSNYLCDISKERLAMQNKEYFDIRIRSQMGAFEVPFVSNSYLIQSKHLDKLKYFDGSCDDADIVFSRSAREAGIKQYISNTQEYGQFIRVFEHLNSIQVAQLERFLED